MGADVAAALLPHARVKRPGRLRAEIPPSGTHLLKKESIEEEQNTFLHLTGEKKEEIQLIFRGNSIRYIREYETKRAKRIEEAEDGLYFYQETAIAPDVIRWIRGFGPEVKVIKPEWLAKQLREEASYFLRS